MLTPLAPPAEGNGVFDVVPGFEVRASFELQSILLTGIIEGSSTEKSQTLAVYFSIRNQYLRRDGDGVGFLLGGMRFPPWKA